MGDASGIGPEIVLKYFLKNTDQKTVRCVVYGHIKPLQDTAAKLGFSAKIFETSLDELRQGLIVEPGMVPVISCVDGELPSVQFGVALKEYARLQHQALTSAVKDALAGRIDAIVTAPWTKEILALAGIRPTGHTEVLGELCGVNRPVMMLAGDILRVVLTTTHVPHGDVPGLLTPEKIEYVIRTTAQSLRDDFGIEKPRLVVAALNPHAGEHGIMGIEEEMITGVVELARQSGLDVVGPMPADTLFVKAILGEWDSVVCMYHDQALIPLKLAHFRASANITLGLPVVRTSVDHGTAYDIAGQGVADPSSFLYAVKTAVRLVEKRKDCRLY